MSEFNLTSDQRQCLRMWFRQAAQEVERREVVSLLLQRAGADDRQKGAHRACEPAKRSRRSRVGVHSRVAASV